jgi:hypothetical protein
MPRADVTRHVFKEFLKEDLFLRFVEALIELAIRGRWGGR